MKLLMKKRKFTLPTWIALATLGLAACSDDNVITPPQGGDDYAYVGKAVGNFTAAEWYPGGELGTTENVGHSSYEDETPAVTAQGLDESFKFGEAFFRRSTASVRRGSAARVRAAIPATVTANGRHPTKPTLSAMVISLWFMIKTRKPTSLS